MTLPLEDPVSLLKALIDIPSTTWEEGPVCEALAATLEGAGFSVERQMVSPGRFNVIARVGDPLVTLSTHLDCVPPHLEARDLGDRIEGRGACDAKGLITAQIFAAMKLRAEGLDNFGLLFMVGEEEGGDGAKVANRTPGRNRFIINAEPTDFKQAVAGKGVLRLTLTSTGRAAHAAYPELGESAVLKLLDVLAELRAFPWPDDPVLGPTTMNIGTLKAGIKPNIIPPHAAAEIMFRTVTPWNDILARVLEIAGDRAAIEVNSTSEPIHLKVVPGFGRGEIVVRFGTDIPYLDAWGQAMLFGPGSIHDAHTAHEFILKRDLIEAVDVYASLVRSLLAAA
ncbi:MAG: M20/M25/M40 family metallo-hydrolase [Vicinamibacteria bacterium]|nr:M20/M25/M40 family metallo-hydrolase [Vicinamibacteria bacterium]